MIITKRIAKEVHNEKVKSFDEGYDKGYSKANADFLKMIDKLAQEKWGFPCWSIKLREQLKSSEQTI